MKKSRFTREKIIGVLRRGAGGLRALRRCRGQVTGAKIRFGTVVLRDVDPAAVALKDRAHSRQERPGHRSGSLPNPRTPPKAIPLAFARACFGNHYLFLPR